MRLAAQILSKFELRRVCKTIGAAQLAKLVRNSATLPQVLCLLMLLVPQGPCTPEELGNCSSIAVEDIGDTRVTVFRQDDSDAQISTVLLRGGTKNGLDDLQRSIGACGGCLLRLDC